jgi:hypothetical protein
MLRKEIQAALEAAAAISFLNEASLLFHGCGPVW